MLVKSLPLTEMAALQAFIYNSIDSPHWSRIKLHSEGFFVRDTGSLHTSMLFEIVYRSFY